RDLAPDRRNTGMVGVNSAGRRFVNEARSCHDSVEPMFDRHKVEPTIPAYLICDGTFIEKYGFGNIHPGTRDVGAFERSGYIVTGHTLDELAQKIGVPPAPLRGTGTRHNGFAEAGVDGGFGKGETELNRVHG